MSCSVTFSVLFIQSACSYIWAEGWVQHVGLQPLKVDVSENGVFLDLCGPSTLAAQSLFGVLGKELTHRRRRENRRD